jgi:predicted O-methyltransferase YrrM
MKDALYFENIGGLAMSNIKDPIISQIEKMVQDISGWSPVDQLYTLFNLVYMTNGLQGDIIEIGSWCGRSACVLGQAAKLIGDTQLISIDLFPEKNDWKQNKDGSYSMVVEIDGKQYGGYKEQSVWKEPFEKQILPLYEKHQGIFEIFQENITRNNLSKIVKAFKGDSAMLPTVLPSNFKCKLAFIDGDHDYTTVCQDIRNIDELLVKGGWICFDDAFSSYEGVDRAITDLIINNPNYELGQQFTRKFFAARKKNV